MHRSCILYHFHCAECKYNFKEISVRTVFIHPMVTKLSRCDFSIEKFNTVRFVVNDHRFHRIYLWKCMQNARRVITTKILFIAIRTRSFKYFSLMFHKQNKSICMFAFWIFQHSTRFIGNFPCSAHFHLIFNLFRIQFSIYGIQTSNRYDMYFESKIHLSLVKVTSYLHYD